MTKQLSQAEFLDVLAKSNLLESERVAAFCAKLSGGSTADELAEKLTAAGLLTKFQASHLLRGRWHRYFIGPYKVMERIGTGTNGQVYLCEHTRMKRRAAVKVLQADKAQSEEAVKRFEREAMAAAAIRHPNIVHAYDLGRDGRLHYLVMEYVDGRSLLQLLTEEGRLPPRRAVHFMWQAAVGLHTAHQAGVIHRDIKPSNLMIAKDGRLKILDLGLARYAGDNENLTRGGAVLGLAAYIAPEQASDSHNVDPRADIYGLGATFWLAVTGKKPPVYGTFDPPPARNPADAADYDKLLTVIKKMMALRPEERYRTAGEVVEALGEFIEPGSTLPAAETRTPAPVGSQPVRMDAFSQSTVHTPAGRATNGLIVATSAIAARPTTAVEVTPMPLFPPTGESDVDLLTFGSPGSEAAIPLTSQSTTPSAGHAALIGWRPWAFLGFGVAAFLAALAYLVWG